MATLSSPTLQDLIASVRTLLNQPDPNNSFWKDDELTRYLNEAVRIYFLEIVQNLEGHFTTTASLDITSGSDTVPLPSDCFQVRTVYKKLSNGYTVLAYRNNLTEDFTTQGGSSAGSYMPYYYFMGNSLVLRPVPQFSETGGLRIEYIQFPQNLVYGGDVMTAQVSPVFRQVIEMYAVYKAKVKESLVNGVQVQAVAESNLSALIKSFRDSIQLRSKNPTYVIPFSPDGE